MEHTMDSATLGSCWVAGVCLSPPPQLWVELLGGAHRCMLPLPVLTWGWAVLNSSQAWAASAVSTGIMPQSIHFIIKFSLAVCSQISFLCNTGLVILCVVQRFYLLNHLPPRQLGFFSAVCISWLSCLNLELGHQCGAGIVSCLAFLPSDSHAKGSATCEK